MMLRFFFLLLASSLATTEGLSLVSKPGVTRRGWIASAGAASVASILGNEPALATTPKTTSFQDDKVGFSLRVPESWTQSLQTASDRRKLVLFQDPEDNKTLLFIAYTPVRDDFTSLGSFGSVDQVAQMTILPKGELLGEDNKAEMISAVSQKQAYYFDYKQMVPGQPETHFRTIFTLVQGATGGAGAVLVTITVQTPEVRYAELKPLVDEIIDSFGR